MSKLTPKLTNETVERVSALARLKLTAPEIESLAETLSAVLENFEQISKVDTSGIAPLITPTDMTMSVREDIVDESIADSEKLLANAPEKSGRLFKVPPVV